MAPRPLTELTDYLSQVATRLHELLGEELVGVYAGGSIALGGYEPGRSDVDVAAVSRGALPVETRSGVAAELRHESLPCPARGLELVLYSSATVRVATRDPGYELDLNTGRAMPLHFSVDPSEAPGRHWYVIDRAILREHGRVLAGPRPEDLFAPIPRTMLLPALRDSLHWHETAGDARPDDAVLNGCRAWLYATEGRWSSKVDAAAWARLRVDDPELIEAAIAARRGGRRLESSRVESFLGRVRRHVDALAGPDATSSPA